MMSGKKLKLKEFIPLIPQQSANDVPAERIQPGSCTVAFIV